MELSLFLACEIAATQEAHDFVAHRPSNEEHFGSHDITLASVLLAPSYKLRCEQEYIFSVPSSGCLYFR